VCYPLIVKDERKKLDPVARHCALVGEGLSGHMILVDQEELLIVKMSSLMRWNSVLRRSLMH